MFYLLIQEIRVKFEYRNEKRITQLRRPVTFHQLQQKMIEFFGYSYSMLFAAGGKNEVLCLK